jgi:hypothetical protein
MWELELVGAACYSHHYKMEQIVKAFDSRPGQISRQVKKESRGREGILFSPVDRQNPVSLYYYPSLLLVLLTAMNSTDWHTM